MIWLNKNFVVWIIILYFIMQVYNFLDISYYFLF